MWAFGAAACLCLPIPASADEIANTAKVSYRQGSLSQTRLSNTVVTELQAAPTPAALQFLSLEPDSAGTSPIIVDGGQCRAPGGSFIPLPVLDEGKGPGPIQVGAASRYDIGAPVVVSVSDPNRNLDPQVREYVDVDLATTSDDVETLRMLETGPDTGIFAAAIESVPVPPAATGYDCILSLVDGATITARYLDSNAPANLLSAVATAHGGATATDIRLEQTASKDVVEIGDFLQYTLIVYNVDQAPATDVQIRDLLPPGLRYQAGTMRVGDAYPATAPAAVLNGTPGAGAAGGTGVATAAASTGRRTIAAQFRSIEPALDNDGHGLLFSVGDLASGEAVKATFVAEVGAGVNGDRLVNFAIATANGAISSNETDTVVRMVESLNMLRFTLIGRVMAVDSCDAVGTASGVGNVRLLLQDGSFAPSDEDGLYHFEGLLPGTHVVQLDPASIPADMEAVACQQNTRFAGRADSQFVESQGGSLHRADFYLRRKGGTVGTRLKVAAAGDTLRYVVDIDGGPISVAKLRAMVMLPADATLVPGSVTLDGEAASDPVLSEGIAIFGLGDPGMHWRLNLAFSVVPVAGSCPDGGYPTRVVGMFEAGGSASRTPPIDLVLPCTGADGPADSGRIETQVTAAAAGPAASPRLALGEIRGAVLDDATAAGQREPGQWFQGQAPGRDWLFPAIDYNPRSPTSRIVVKHLPNDKLTLVVNGQPVDPLHYEGSLTSVDKTVAVSRWRGIGLLDGRNALHVEITDASGATVAVLDRDLYYSNTPARVELVPDRSILAADGFNRPVVAIRVLDRSGHPVRKGTTGPYEISAPYEPAMSVEMRQERQIAGTGGERPIWLVEGDDGVAYIELQPTGTAGSASLAFQFDNDGQAPLRQEMQVWLKSAPRDWVVVGFAKGSVGYETLREYMESLPPGEDGGGVRGDGQVSLYAKGRVLGEWLLTVAYDSDKDTGRLRNQSLLSTIDPGQYYTLYGDASQQGYDAASASKLYLKLERDQFYALFGDFQTGLDRNELSRYQRTLNGIKVEYRGPLVEVNGFAANTSQNHVRDDIQGDGTSGLYNLRHRLLVLNSERIRIEVRDRYHSEQILDTRELVRHIDYDIDHAAGTVFFREPIASRDFDFNPIWIVAEYETRGTGEEFLNGGGRVGIRALEGKLEAGATYIRDEDGQARSELAGVDARFRLTERDELRAEVASSRSDGRSGESSGNAWLVEWQHRGERLNLLAYARRQSPGFGLGQQSGNQAGMAKFGMQGQYRLGANFSLQGEAYRVENLASGAVRDVAKVETEYRGDDWSVRAGLQAARDTSIDGQASESRQATLGASKLFLDNRLELGAQADVSLGGRNESVDFPTRLQLNAGYKINEAFRVLAAQEFTDGEDRDTATTRFGFEAKPWKDATLTTTLNQSRISEYGPRSFAQFGLNQRFVANERWSFDLALDSSRAFNESGDAPLIVDPSQPIQPGGIRDGGALTEDFMALSAGTTYRNAQWMWNLRAETRHGDTTDRHGFSTAFLRQVKDGVAMSASAQAFFQSNADGSTGILANAQLSWAWRPLGSKWSMLDKLEFRLDELRAGTGESIIGQGMLAVTGNARSARFLNNFVLNYASGAWDGEDAAGNPLDLYQRSQLSLYYGSKYVIDSYGENDHKGYTDIIGAEYRFDLTRRIDIGIRGGVLHSWSEHTFAWAFGPSVGFTPFDNAWVSVGYNIRGFNDRDFEASHYTAQGAYLVFRMKFDQGTFGMDRVKAPGL